MPTANPFLLKTSPAQGPWNLLEANNVSILLRDVYGDAVKPFAKMLEGWGAWSTFSEIMRNEALSLLFSWAHPSKQSVTQCPRGCQLISHTQCGASTS